ncbi:MAG: AMP-binding protein [Pseudomonadota bacterium]|nr:AMP-binding protein [Pseudomonadota bacterium]
MATVRPDGIALISGEQSVTFDEISRQASAMADALAAMMQADVPRVALMTRDQRAFLATYAACLGMGWTAVVIDPDAAPIEVARMLDLARADALVVDADSLGRLRADVPESVPRGGITIGGRPRRRESMVDRLLGRKAVHDGGWVADADLDPAPEAFLVPGTGVDDGRAAHIIFTSGTTSRPKGVVISRRALFAHVRTLARVFGYGPGAVLLNYLPFHHTDGLVHGAACGLLTGMAVVRPGKFTVEAAANLPDMLRETGATHFLAVPTMLAMVRRLHNGRADLFRTPRFRTLISTAGYLEEGFWAAFEQDYGQRIANFYGMTETVSGALYCGPDDATWRRGTLGRPIDAQTRLVDAAGRMVGRGEVGELQISGTLLMDGYLDDEIATAQVLREGWLSTGDLFRIDQDGMHVFVGRQKTIIKRGGITIYPEDVRKVIADMPGVREVEVVGVPDPVFEELIVACVVLDSGDTHDISVACNASLAVERRPDRIVLLDELPRGPSGKVQRDALLALIPAHEAVDHGAGDVRTRVFAIAEEVFKADPGEITSDATPKTLINWDSYAHLEFVTALEEAFSVRFSARDVMRLRTIGHAVETVRRLSGLA